MKIGKKYIWVGLMVAIFAAHTCSASFVIFGDENPNQVFVCRNLTGQKIGSSATMDCYDTSNVLDVNGVALDNIGTGIFNFSFGTLMDDRYTCVIDCGDNNPQPVFIVEMRPSVADTIWDENISTHTGVNSAGSVLSDLLTYIKDLWDQMIGGW